MFHLFKDKVKLCDYKKKNPLAKKDGESCLSYFVFSKSIYRIAVHAASFAFN